jgi:hypothetical protein
MRCVICGWPKDSHSGPELVCPDWEWWAGNHHYTTLALPEGKTCADCRFSTFCDQFIGPDRNLNQCDWYPIRFVQKVQEAPCAE